MDTLSAFARGEANRHKEQMVFDWDKAAEIIKDRQPQCASAGLSQDWEYTSGKIFEDGKIVTDYYTYLASTWATPELDIDGEVISCYKMQSEVSDWNSETKWPESALKILGVS